LHGTTQQRNAHRDRDFDRRQKRSRGTLKQAKNNIAA
jgi:hypothetical protein